MYLRILYRSWRVQVNNDYFLTLVSGVCCPYQTGKAFREMAVSLHVNESGIKSSKAKASVWLRRKKFEVLTAVLTRIQVMSAATPCRMANNYPKFWRGEGRLRQYAHSTNVYQSTRRNITGVLNPPVPVDLLHDDDVVYLNIILYEIDKRYPLDATIYLLL